MNKHLLIVILVYWAAISLISIILTAVDKHRAKKNKWRITEKALLLSGFLGGALAEYITMKIIRHKTLHKKFMVGLPLEILFHVLLIVFIYIRFILNIV